MLVSSSRFSAAPCRRTPGFFYLGTGVRAESLAHRTRCPDGTSLRARWALISKHDIPPEANSDSRTESFTAGAE
jgi:hypothetical protein